MMKCVITVSCILAVCFCVAQAMTTGDPNNTRRTNLTIGVCIVSVDPGVVGFRPDGTLSEIKSPSKITLCLFNPEDVAVAVPPGMIVRAIHSELADSDGSRYQIATPKGLDRNRDAIEFETRPIVLDPRQAMTLHYTLAQSQEVLCADVPRGRILGSRTSDMTFDEFMQFEIDEKREVIIEGQQYELSLVGHGRVSITQRQDEVP